MNRPALREIIQFSSAQKTWPGKVSYLLKGLLFFTILTGSRYRTFARDELASTSSQAGDDIYPLF